MKCWGGSNGVCLSLKLLSSLGPRKHSHTYRYIDLLRDETDTHIKSTSVPGGEYKINPGLNEMNRRMAQDIWLNDVWGATVVTELDREGEDRGICFKNNISLNDDPMTKLISHFICLTTHIARK